MLKSGWLLTWKPKRMKSSLCTDHPPPSAQEKWEGRGGLYTDWMKSHHPNFLNKTITEERSQESYIIKVLLLLTALWRALRWYISKANILAPSLSNRLAQSTNPLPTAAINGVLQREQNVEHIITNRPTDNGLKHSGWLCWTDRGSDKIDYEQSLFFLGPSSKTRETRKWPHTWLKAWHLVSRVSLIRRSTVAFACTAPTKSEEKHAKY